MKNPFEKNQINPKPMPKLLLLLLLPWKLGWSARHYHVRESEDLDLTDLNWVCDGWFKDLVCFRFVFKCQKWDSNWYGFVLKWSFEIFFFFFGVFWWKKKGGIRKKKMIGRKGEKFQKWMRERERVCVCVCYNVARWNNNK